MDVVIDTHTCVSCMSVRLFETLKVLCVQSYSSHLFSSKAWDHISREKQELS